MAEGSSTTPDQLMYWLFSTAVTILGGVTGFTHWRISGVRREGREDLEAMHQAIEQRLAEGRADRERLWAELRSLQKDSVDQNRRLLERLGMMPTREDMRQEIASLKADVVRLLENGRAAH